MTWWEYFKRGSSAVLPSGLSFLRVAFGIAIPFLILVPSDSLRLLAFGLFLGGVVTDYLDGWFARKYNLVTDFGKILDPTADKILILSPLVAFAFLGYYSLWWIVPIFIREVLVTFCRIGWLLEGKAAGAEKLGKLKFGVQVATVLFLFFHLIVENRIAEWGLGKILGTATILFLLASNVFTLVSGASFLYANKRNFNSRAFAKYVSACGVGLIPVMPGTWGSLLGVAIFLLAGWNAWLYIITTAFIFFAATWSISQLDLSEARDPQFVVIDEVLGILTTLFYIPFKPEWIAVGFVLFRIFDIFKPFPLRKLEKLPGYWGIVGDDLGAGIYSRLVLQCLL